MSLIYKCDICGKDSAMNGVEFSDGPIVMKLPNYNNETMRIYLQLSVEAESDFEKIQQIKAQIQNIADEVGEELTMEEAVEDPEIYEELNQIKINLDNPFPMICNCCKKLIAKDMLTKAEFPPTAQSCAKESVRTDEASKALDKINLKNRD